MKKISTVLIIAMFFLTGCSGENYDNEQYRKEQLIETLENDGWTCIPSRCVFADDVYSYEYNLVENTYEFNLNSFEVIDGYNSTSNFKVASYAFGMG